MKNTKELSVGHVGISNTESMKPKNDGIDPDWDLISTEEG